MDILIAKIGYDEVGKYKKEKAEFYVGAMRRIGGYEINMVQNMGEIWNDWGKCVRKSKADYFTVAKEAKVGEQK